MKRIDTGQERFLHQCEKKEAESLSNDKKQIHEVDCPSPAKERKKEEGTNYVFNQSKGGQGEIRSMLHFKSGSRGGGGHSKRKG